MVVPGTAAHFARHVHIRQKVHLHFRDAVSAAGLTSAALHVKAEPAFGISPNLRFRHLGKKIPNMVEHSRISGRVGSRCPSDWRLVDIDNLIKVLNTLNLPIFARRLLQPIGYRRNPFVNNPVHQAALAGTGYTGHAYQLSCRNLHIDIFQIVLRSSQHSKGQSVSFPPLRRNFDFPNPGQILTGDGFLTCLDILHRSLSHQLAAVNSGPRTDIHDVIRRIHGILVMLYHD